MSAIESRQRVELLAPAGNWDCARAAIANGADAIYFGLDCGFNARARAHNFTLEELPRLIDFLHAHGVAGYVTLNTLSFSDELEQVERVAKEVALAGTDAVLVQDLGVAQLVRAISPTLEIHASTQMSMTSAETIQAIESLGVSRVVLARELSIKEIAKIHEATKMPLEAFVHGALCVAYSGQCLTSESLGGRSANRGQCAQACRLPYELVADGQLRDLGDQKYLLSPQDLAAYDLVPELIKAGVISLKIEGRLKTPEYVANITSHYRRAIDAALSEQSLRFSQRDREEMELSFSRGFSPGWLNGCDHKMLVPGLTSAKQGVYVGDIVQVKSRRVVVDLKRSLKPGDGIVFEGDRVSGDEQGGRVFAIYRSGQRVREEIRSGRVELEFPRDSIDFAKLTSGLQVRKNDDPALQKKLRKTFQGDLTGRSVDLQLDVIAKIGQPLRVVVNCSSIQPFELTSEVTLQEATKHPLDLETLEKQFGRLGGTSFHLRSVKAHIEGQPMMPLSQFGKLRRAMVETLQEELQKARLDLKHEVRQGTLIELRLRDSQSEKPAEATPRQLHVLVRSLKQLRTLIESGERSFLVDFADIRQYRDATELARENDVEIWLATPRIQKPGELGIFKAMSRHEATGVLVRNLAALDYFHEAGCRCLADFSLNAANELTTAWLLKKGAERVTVSYDLNRDQLEGMLPFVDTSKLEVVIHQHMPMFHMEHCVFCSVMSPGTNKTNCGRPCDHHEVALRDRTGVDHPLTADVGCRNTLFNAVPQSGAEVVPALLRHGVSHFRIELLRQSSTRELQAICQLYRKLLDRSISPQEVWTKLQAANRVGVTRGTLEAKRNPLAII